ncbi:MFS transporter [Prauserella cavernicola]|uniref:Putative proline/betaine transporter n=1 Tax=Prauserella cavernicola TaxID=2800127 RepID=A0A934V1P7_9PSEU|nr:MFS transporter [Prauserella cavernicola]MBK1783641.1 MHS family MFS transporter [Prauserella cavernicola]
MSTSTSSGPSSAQSRRAALGSFAGTTLEWYDFFIYGTTAALVFGDVFFPTQEGVLGTLAAFATFAVGFLARPIGSVLFGHFGDRLGRRNVLIATLLIMGGATVVIGLIPSYDSIGVWAPVLLTVCRVAQGIALGGEWGGAALLSVENAPAKRKGLFGSSTQLGSPAGLLLASLVIAGSSAISGDAFGDWGWRIPFLASAVIVVVGLAIRRGLAESDDFEETKEKGAVAAMPVLDVLREDWRSVLLGAGLAAANNALYYTVATYTLAYVTDNLDVPKGETLNHLTIVSLCYLVSIPLFGWLADRIGLRRQVMIGALLAAAFAFPYFAMIETGNSLVILLGMIIGLALVQSAAYAPQPAIYCELFPAKTRYTGASLSYALPTTIVGGTTPFIATWLYSVTGSNTAMAAYIVGLSLVAATCAALAHRRHVAATRAEAAEVSEVPDPAGGARG